MSVVGVVAVYAAAVSTGSLVWQVRVHRQRLRTRVRVEVRHALVPTVGFQAHGATSIETRPAYQVTISAVNEGETTETAEAIGFHDRNHTAGCDERGFSEELLPGGVVKHAFELWDLHFDPSRGVVPFVELASSGRITGRLEPLHDEIVDDARPMVRPVTPAAGSSYERGAT
jgi:hypothetical protein